jgi:photosystem II stability/assembly factor-like uncharacterized protein
VTEVFKKEYSFTKYGEIEMRKFGLLLAFVLFSFNAACAQNFEWRLMNSAITAFATLPGSPNTVFAGDMAGMIRRSDDKGETWEVASMQAESQIRDIAFLNATTGFATTNEWGLVLKTTDGGKTWTRVQLAENNNGQVQPVRNTSRIVVVDEMTAYFDIFNHPISAPSGKVGVVTRDGGLTFKSDTTPGEVYHVSGSTLIAFGREIAQFGLSKFTVYKSTDKGLSWQIVKTSPTGLSGTFDNNGIELAHFLNENEFFITANISIGNDGYVYKTTDGGQTFTQLGKFPSGDPEYIYFKNATEGFAIAGSNSTRSTFTTSDGGVTWVQSDKNMQYTAEYLGNDIYISYTSGRTAISTDFGKTWTEQADALQQQKSAGMSFLQLINDSTAFASLGGINQGTYFGRELLKTTNGGLTWKQVKNGEGTVFKGENFYFVSADTFFFIGTGYAEGSTTQGGYMKIRYTTDGGLTSRDLFTGNYWEEIAEIVFIDKMHAVTYSSNSNVTNYSTDGGMTWTATNYTNLGQVTKMVFPSVNAWYATNSNQKLFKSIDQGKTWNDISDNFSCGMIYFLDATTGFKFGCSRKIFKTTDGGTTWADLTSGLLDQIKNNNNSMMDFQNSSVGFMADPNANGIYALSKTTDGGQTWNWYNQSQLNYRVMRIDFKNENTAAMLDGLGGFARYVGPQNFTTDTIYLNAPAVSVTEFLKESSIAVYPNPANDYVVLKSRDEIIQSVEISNVMGQILLKQNLSNAENLFKIGTENFGNGMYFVKITTARGVVLKQLNIVR